MIGLRQSRLSRRRSPFAVVASLAALLTVGVSIGRGAEPIVAEIVQTTGAFGKLAIGAATGLKLGDQGTMAPVAGIGKPTPVVVTAVKPDYVVVQVQGGEPLIGQQVRFEGVGRPIDRPVAGSPFWKPEETPIPVAAKAGGPEPGSPFWSSSETNETLSAPAETFEGFRGKSLDLMYRNGQRLKDVTIENLDVEGGNVVRMRVYEARERRFIDIDVEDLEKIDIGYILAWQTNLKGIVKTKARSRAERLLEQMEQRARVRDEAIEAVLAETKLERWPRLSQEEREKIVAEDRRFGEEDVAKRFTNLRLYETERFLFFSTIAPDQVGKYILALDKMYDLLVKLYQLSPSDQLFRGKASVFAFETQKEFLIYQIEFQKNPDAFDALGICATDIRTGRVTLSCWKGDDPLEFEHTIVHEMSHGFLSRYKTPANPPSWLHEGLAQYVGKTLVPKYDMVDRSIEVAIFRIRSTRRIGNDIFSEDEPITADEYGPATCLTLFLMKDSERFLQLLDGVKGGLPTEEALRRAYGVDYYGLAQAYGESIGVRGLTP